ncbi:5-oxoprolinase subunit PxpB [Suttonella ornithocola]|uniref:Sporulation inhibitor kipI n=1 Tax=Suttonella ornithocola TaxID=279832 RepID=A0A380MS66_9GAMM|nr:5-oxoprolinase subunit PxpB [Suttonella ornithocola]SUO95014.1 Sporulation inhibitor kipI [Suttonella ornithocola]
MGSASLTLTAKCAGEQEVILYLPEPAQASYPAWLSALGEGLKKAFPEIVDVVPAYASLLVCGVKVSLPELLSCAQMILDTVCQQTIVAPRCIEIPVCYDAQYAPDLATLAKAKGLAVEEVVALHTGKRYDVFAVGFIPGFAFLGYVDARIEMPRHLTPKPVQAGSVGIAGRQTGCYPLNSPGGWQIIGRTPKVLYAPEQGHFGEFSAGDKVQFIAISAEEFLALEAGEV